MATTEGKQEERSGVDGGCCSSHRSAASGRRSPRHLTPSDSTKPEIDALIRFHKESLRLVLEEAQKKLREKDSELARVNRKLAEFEVIEIEKAGKKLDKKENYVAAPMPKVTGDELQRRQEKERLSLRKVEENKKENRMTSMNHEDSLIEEISIGEGPVPPADRHLEKEAAATIVDKSSEGRKEEAVAREYTVNLQIRLHGCTFKKMAPKAIKEIRNFAQKAMETTDVRVDIKLNKHIWSRGIRSVPRRVRVRIARKRNEEEDAKEELCSLVTFAGVPAEGLKGLGTKLQIA